MSLMPPRTQFTLDSLTSDDLAAACGLAAECVKALRTHNNTNLEETLRYLEQQFRAGNIRISRDAKKHVGWTTP